MDQHAYRAGRSTESALQIAMSIIEEQLQAGGYAMGPFLDVDGAFNNTSTNSICEAARRKGVPDTLTTWIKNTLSNRRLTVSKGSNTVTGMVENGCTWGGG